MRLPTFYRHFLSRVQVFSIFYRDITVITPLSIRRGAGGEASSFSFGEGVRLQLLHNPLKMLTFVCKAKSFKGVNPNKQID